MDAYRLGNRQSFNTAFKKLELDCASWPEPVYLDLLRMSAGDEEKMVNLYFNRIGWPSSLLTNEKASFVKNVLQRKKIAMDEFLMSESLTLRPGVEEFIDEAYKEGIPVVVLTTYSKSGDQIARSIVEKLGQERVSKLKIVGVIAETPEVVDDGSRARSTWTRRISLFCISQVFNLKLGNPVEIEGGC